MPKPIDLLLGDSPRAIRRRPSGRHLALLARLRWSLLPMVALAALGAGCDSPEPSGPTEALCPQGSTLTYENFGEPFMENYCTRCHSSELIGSARQGAPLYHDFDSLEGILVVADHVDEYAASGPAATNEVMPPDGDEPSREERTQLGEWLACELDKINSSAR